MRYGLGSAKQDSEQLNIIKQIKIFNNYRGYSEILYIRPFINAHMGFLNDDFFGYEIQAIDNEKATDAEKIKYNQLLFMEPYQAIDYYLDNIPFKIPSLEYDTFRNRKGYKIYVNSLTFLKERRDEK